MYNSVAVGLQRCDDQASIGRWVDTRGADGSYKRQERSLLFIDQTVVSTVDLKRRHVHCSYY